MIKFTNNINKINYDRRKELIERSNKILELIENNRTRSSYKNGLEWKLSKAKSLYWKKYTEHLNIDEETILYLYVTFPSNEELLKLLAKYDNSFKKIAEIYGVSTSFVRLRYINLLFMEINKAKDISNEKKTLEENKNSFKTLKLTIDFKN